MKVVAVDGLIGFNDDIVALADPDEELFCDKGLNRNEVRRDDCQVVTIKTDFEIVIRGSIDKSQSILLTFDNGIALISSTASRIDIYAVDENIVGTRGAADQTSRELPD